MDLMHVNPFIRYCRMHYYGISDKKPRQCYDCRFYYIEEGSGTLSFNAQNIRFSQGSAIFLPFGTQYVFSYDSSEIRICAINFDLFDQYTEFPNSLGTPYADESDPVRILSYLLPKEFAAVQFWPQVNFSNRIAQMCELFAAQQAYFREKAGALFKICLLELAEQNSRYPYTETVQHVLQYIRAQYADPQLNNEKIASYFGYHPYYLNSIVRQATGETLHQHLLQYRLTIAAQLLNTTDFDVQTIAWKTGFYTVSYFIRQFRLKNDVTPLQYRKQHRVL